MTTSALRSAGAPGRLALISGVLVWLGVVLVLPLIVVFTEAFAKGADAFASHLLTPDILTSIWLSLGVTAVAAPLNAIFGVAAAWSITKFEFRGKALLLTLIDLPVSMSPVISGLVWSLLFGSLGVLAPMLDALHIRIVFAFPGLVLATALVSLPFVARELIPLMSEQGVDEESAAVTLGAGGWSVFFRVTLPNIRWALLSGVLLTTARAMGEFGAVSVVSGRVFGQTMTLTLEIEQLYNNFDFVGAFAAAALLSCLGLLVLIAKIFLERRTHAA